MMVMMMVIMVAVSVSLFANIDIYMCSTKAKTYCPWVMWLVSVVVPMVIMMVV
jgi:hypothetical protein